MYRYIIESENTELPATSLAILVQLGFAVRFESGRSKDQRREPEANGSMPNVEFTRPRAPQISKPRPKAKSEPPTNGHSPPAHQSGTHHRHMPGLDERHRWSPLANKPDIAYCDWCGMKRRTLGPGSFEFATRDGSTYHRLPFGSATPRCDRRLKTGTEQ